MNKDELQGKGKKIKGQVKQEAGRLTGDERLSQEGADDQAEGEIQEGVGKARRKVGEAVESLGRKVKE
jgi:uncharacterized protein YjbJ (UPF0337 family)